MVYYVGLSGLLSKTLAYTNYQRLKLDKVWKTQQTMVYSIGLSGLLSKNLEYIHGSKVKTK